MNDEARERILARVRKMLRLAQDAGATEGERDNAMRMAHATLAKHNLDLALATATKEKESATDAARVNHTSIYGGWPWARAISMNVAKLFFCEYIYSDGKGVWTTRHYFIGRTANAVTASLVAEFVVKAVIREAQRIARVEYRNNAFVRSFGWGAAERIRQRVAELMIDPAQVDGDRKNALVLASFYDTETERNKQAMEVWFPKDSRKDSRMGKTQVRVDAYAAGQAYGDTVSLQPQIGGK